MSVLLIILGYQNSKAFNEKIAEERMGQSAEQIKLTFQNLTIPVFSSINALSASDFASQLHSDNQRRWIGQIDAIISNNPEIISVYLGYNDGRSFFFRTMGPAFMKSRFLAPKKAHLMVDINQRDGIQIRRFYDKNLALIATRTDTVDYNPTTRPWFKDAPSNGSIHITAPYLYHFIQQKGISFSKRLAKDHAVVAVDITIDSLDVLLDTLTLSKKAQIIVFDDRKEIIAERGVDSDHTKNADPTLISHSPFQKLFDENKWQESVQTIDYKGQKWRLNLVRIVSGNEQDLWLAKAVPEIELIRDAIQTRNNQIVLTLVMLLIGIFMVWWASEKIATLLKKLIEATFSIRNLNFKDVDIPKSNIIEISALSGSVRVMSETIQRFLNTLQHVSKSSDFNELLTDMVTQCEKMADADFVLMWSSTLDNNDSTQLSAYIPDTMSCTEIGYENLLRDIPELRQALDNNESFSFSIDKLDQKITYFPPDLQHAWVLPLLNRNNQHIGCVFIGFNQLLKKWQEDKIHFIQVFLSFVSLIKENWEHITAEKKLFSSFVEMIASAIDTKSPYTGAHCQRVPILTFMLADAVNQDTQFFAEFNLNDSEALHIASWLHDCGKVTTPEYVVDKATKLETIYNRIHEIRTRFEVLKRDAQIIYWEKRQDGEPEEELNIWLSKEHAALDDDFAFIAKCNGGEISMSGDDLKRLHSIAKRTWQRTMDDSLGLSWEEENRRQNDEKTAFPFLEPLLSDRIDQQISWSIKQKKTFENWTFKMAAPHLQYNRGELYNLSIVHGTLTKEERFIINDHIIQTINMLKKLPYPDHLRRVPEIAGGHHERIDGKGYPNGLTEKELPIETRMMAIADIFEALTASDRPYKKEKSLSQSLNILAYMAKNKHIDIKLFRIFLEKKVYLEYAEKFLPKEQCDEVNEKELLAIIDSQ